MPDYDTIQRRRNTIVGVFVLAALVALGWLIIKFQDLPTAVSKWKSYEVRVQFASAPGIAKNTPVRLGGYPVGRVIKVMAPAIRKEIGTGREYLQTLVILAIDKKYLTKIPSNCDVKLMKRGLGSSYIEIQIDPSRPLERRDPNVPESIYFLDKMCVQGGTGLVSEFFPEESQQKLDELAAGLNRLIENVNEVIGDKENKENIRLTLANLTEATSQAKKTLKEIEQLGVVGQKAVKNADNKLTEAADIVIDSGEELNFALRELRVMLEKVNKGDGTAGRLLNDGRLYENLLYSTEELQAALEEFKLLMAELREKGILKVF